MRSLDEVDWGSLEEAYGPAVEVPHQVRALAADRDEALGGLIALGTRHPGLANTVAGILWEGGAPDAFPAVPPMQKMFSAIFDARRDAGDELDALDEAMALGAARDLYQRLSAHLPPGSPFPFRTATEVPTELALPLLVGMPIATLHHANTIQMTAYLCAYVQRPPAEAFFFSAVAARALRRDFDPSAALEVALYVSDQEPPCAWRSLGATRW